jgi:hypothetical protein
MLADPSSSLFFFQKKNTNTHNRSKTSKIPITIPAELFLSPDPEAASTPVVAVVEAVF